MHRQIKMTFDSENVVGNNLMGSDIINNNMSRTYKIMHNTYRFSEKIILF